MNETTLQRAKTWSQFSFDEKVTHINRLNDQRRREVEKKRTAKNSRKSAKPTKTKKSSAPKMSKTAQSLFDSLPDNIRKGFL